MSKKKVNFDPKDGTGNLKTGTVKYEVTPDFVLDLYEEAKSKRGKNREELMAQVELLSQNIGAVLVKEE